jgi:hypothetical protein
VQVAFMILLFVGCMSVVLIGFRLKRDRIGVVLQVLGIWCFFNFLESNLPTDTQRLGYGCPFKWQYDPAYRNTRVFAEQQRAVSLKSQWKFDEKALIWDILIGLGLLGIALIVNEIVQISNGNRAHRLTGVKNDLR